MLRVEFAALKVERGVVGLGGELRGEAGEGVVDFRMRTDDRRAEEREDDDGGAGKHRGEPSGRAGLWQSCGADGG